jgi:hypothetical protein
VNIQRRKFLRGGKEIRRPAAAKKIRRPSAQKRWNFFRDCGSRRLT